jgi:hypothetical protein
MQAVKKKSISNPSTEGTNYPCIILFFIVTCRSCRLVFFLLMEVITDAPFSSMCVFLCVCRGRKESQDSEEEEEVVSAKWTLRKQAALVLDNLAVTFSAALVLPHALAAIQLKLQAGAGGSGSAEVWHACPRCFVYWMFSGDGSVSSTAVSLPHSGKIADHFA